MPRSSRLTGRDAAALPDLEALAGCFVEQAQARERFATLGDDGRSWRAELTLALAPPVPVALRVEVVPARDGTVLGHILVLENLTASRRAAQAREHRVECEVHPIIPSTATTNPSVASATTEIATMCRLIAP